jgi:hypothetical protein
METRREERKVWSEVEMALPSTVVVVPANLCCVLWYCCAMKKRALFLFWAKHTPIETE